MVLLQSSRGDLMVKLTCPVCGAEIGLDQAGQAAELMALGRAAAAYGEDWDLVSEYLDLFRARPGGPLLLKKRLRLAREVWELWGGSLEFDGRSYRISREEVREGLRQVCNRAPQALTNHNYLKKILVGLAQGESRKAERERRGREESLLAGRGRPAPPAVVTPENVWRLADPGCPECGGRGKMIKEVPGLSGRIMVRCQCTNKEARDGQEAGGDGDRELGGGG